MSDDKQKKDKRAEKEYDDNGEADESGFHSVVEEYMIPLSDSGELDKDYVKNMSDHDLRIAINEMYARYGYHFKNSASIPSAVRNFLVSAILFFLLFFGYSPVPRAG